VVGQGGVVPAAEPDAVLVDLGLELRLLAGVGVWREDLHEPDVVPLPGHLDVAELHRADDDVLVDVKLLLEVGVEDADQPVDGVADHLAASHERTGGVEEVEAETEDEHGHREHHEPRPGLVHARGQELCRGEEDQRAHHEHLAEGVGHEQTSVLLVLVDHLGVTLGDEVRHEYALHSFSDELTGDSTDKSNIYYNIVF